MPLYLFANERTNEVHEIVFHMNDEKVYNGPDGKQVGQWKRVWTKPLASIDTKVDPFSAKDYVKATNKRDTVGSLWDRSRELSLKRAEKEGSDPIKQRFYDNYSKRRKGAKHPEQRREEGAKKLAKHGIKIDWGTDD